MKIVSIVLVIALPFIASAQAQLWGVLGDPNNNSSNKGVIFHTTNEGTDMQTAYHFKTGNDGHFPTTLVEESPNVVIGTTAKGGFYKCGVIFRFNILTGAYDKLVDFKGIDGDGGSNTLVLASNGKYYGSTPKGGVNYTGNIFEFDPSNDSITRIVGFYGPNGKGQSSPLLIIDSMFYGFTRGGFNYSNNGNFYCIDQGSLLEYNPILNKLTQKSVYYPESTDYLTLAPTSLGFESIPKAKSLISVIPNPAGNFIMIKSDVDIAYVNIYNAEGKLVLHKETSRESSPIDISIFKPGLYLLEATTEKGGIQYSKFIKK